MNNFINSISKVYLIILIPLVSLLVISNILIFAEDTQQQQQQQQQNVTIASDVKDPSFFSFFEKMKNTTISPIVRDNTTESLDINAQNHTIDQDTQVLMMLDIPELKEALMDA